MRALLPQLEDAVCAGIDPEVWFPIQYRHKQTGEDHPDVKTAKGLCRVCPAQVECLEWGLRVDREEGGRYGIYGALTPDERSKLQEEAA